MRIGIILTGDYGWAGGVYYSLNIIKLLHAISRSKDLKIIAIVNSKTPVEIINALPTENIELSYLDKKKFTYKLYHKLIGNRFSADINSLNLDILYPLIEWHPSHSAITCKVYYWIYDFQHKFLPQLFSEEEIKKRDLSFQNISLHGKNVVFSSHDSLNHFRKFYSESKISKHVFHFVSLLDQHPQVTNTEIKVPENYFIVCNQFWPHKNHLIVLKAIALLNEDQKRVNIVFTGKYNDERNKEYVAELKQFIADKQLEPQIVFTGFISREAQVNLILKASAIIQPSFFEGWSTVVEDAKALNKFLIASDISVNKEQVHKNVLFFGPTDENKLASHLHVLHEKKNIAVPADYRENISQAKTDLINLFNI